MFSSSLTSWRTATTNCLLTVPAPPSVCRRRTWPPFGRLPKRLAAAPFGGVAGLPRAMAAAALASAAARWGVLGEASKPGRGRTSPSKSRAAEPGGP